MTTFITFVDERLAALGWLRKQLALEWHQRVGDGSPTTFESRLSKLLNCEDDGYTFLFNDDGIRLEALAAALGCAPEDVRRRAEADRDRVTLVLDPRLSSDQKAFFERRERVGDRFRVCLSPEPSGDAEASRERLRADAKSSRNAIVVVADDTDRLFYEGAGIRSSRVVKAAGRFQLISAPELTEPLPPETTDALDGMPMVPEPEWENHYRALMERMASSSRQVEKHEVAHAERWLRRIQEADDSHSLVTFRLDWLEKRPSPSDLRKLVLERVEAAVCGRPMVFRADDLMASRPYLWVHEGRVLGLGPRDAKLRVCVEQWHPVHEVESLPGFVEAARAICAGLNPHREGGDFGLGPLADAVSKETGIGLDVDTAALRAIVKRAASNEGSDASERCSMRFAGEQDVPLRKVFDELLARDFELRSETASLAFRL